MPSTRPSSVPVRPPYRRTSRCCRPRVARSTKSIRTTAPPDRQRTGPKVAIRREHNDNFRLPVLLRQCFNLMEAKVYNLSQHVISIRSQKF